MSVDVIHITSDIAIIIQVIIAFIAVLFAYNTVTTTKNENRRWHTLAICSQYELNENIVKVNDCLYYAFHNKLPTEDECKRLHRHAIIVLNFLDGIAIGVKQGLYIEELAKDHLKTIVDRQITRLLESGFERYLNLDNKDFQFLIAMNANWREDQPYYHA